MGKSKPYEVEFGGAQTAGEVFDDLYNESAYDRFKHQRGRAPGARAGDADGGYAAEQWEHKLRNEWNHQKARSAATGGWIASAGEPAAELFQDHGMDVNEMKHWASVAGIGTINSSNDVKGILDAKDAAMVSDKELAKALKGLEAKGEGAESTEPPAPVELSSTHQDAKERTMLWEMHGGGNPYNDFAKDTAAYYPFMEKGQGSIDGSMGMGKSRFNKLNESSSSDASEDSSSGYYGKSDGSGSQPELPDPASGNQMKAMEAVSGTTTDVDTFAEQAGANAAEAAATTLKNDYVEGIKSKLPKTGSVHQEEIEPNA